MTIERPGPNGRIDWLDYARLLCALMVVATHYFYAGPRFGETPSVADYGLLGDIAMYGRLGVDFFFVISGYVIMASVGERSAAQFAAARLVRLYPGFVVCMTATAIVTSAGMLPWLVNLTMIPGTFGVERIDEVYWTLVFELQFYFLVFALMLLGQARRLEGFILVWLAIQAAALPFEVEVPFVSSIFTLFCVGSLFHFGEAKGWTPARMLATGIAMALAMWGALLRGDQFVEQSGHPQNLWAIAGVIAAIYLAFIVLSRLRPRLPYAAFLGSLTYPLYLIHQDIGFVLIETLTPAAGRWIATGVTVALMIGASILIAVYAEARPKRIWRALAARVTAPFAWAENALAARRRLAAPAT